MANYFVNAAQSGVLFLDVMRQRGNARRAHLAETAPHVLNYDAKLVIDGRTLEHPVNYVLVRIVPPEDVQIDEKKDKIELTDKGKQLVRYSHAPAVQRVGAVDKLHEHVERALRAHHRLFRDQHYLVEEGQLILIDENTGRRMPDRQWQEGLHQAIEVKERLPPTKTTEAIAQVTFQRYFALYDKNLHKMFYDYESLERIFAEAGFVALRRAECLDSTIPFLGEVEKLNRFGGAVCIEGVKP